MITTLALTAMTSLGCADTSAGGDFGVSTDSAGGGGGDSAGASATMGGGADDDGGGDGGALDLGVPPPPEEEEEGDFRIPQPSGKYVYSASESTDRVAAIDTDDLSINVVDVCRVPSVIEPIPSEGGTAESGAVAVLCTGSNEIAFVRTSAGGETTVELREVTKGANALVASPDGDYVFAYHDVDAETPLGPGSDQEVTALQTQMGGPSYAMTIGSHPRDLIFSPTGLRAYAVTDDGVNVIEIDQLDAVGKPRLVQVVNDAGVDPKTLEIQVSPTQGQAIARIEGGTWLVVTDLVSGDRTQLDLPGFATDLDIAPDGTFAVMALPDQTGSSILEFPLPVSDANDFTVSPVGQEYVGLVDITPDGQRLLLYTTQNPWEGDPESAPLGDPRQRLTLARRGSGDWQDQITVFTEVPVRAVGIAPDSANAVLLHDVAPAFNPAAPWPYTLMDLTAQFPVKKIQTSLARPGPIVFTPDGSRAAIRVRSEQDDVRQIEVVTLDSFIVQRVQLASLPEGISHVDATDKLYVSQAHPSGRITFIDAMGDIQTLTGYELNDSVKD